MVVVRQYFAKRSLNFFQINPRSHLCPPSRCIPQASPPPHNNLVHSVSRSTTSQELHVPSPACTQSAVDMDDRPRQPGSSSTRNGRSPRSSACEISNNYHLCSSPHIHVYVIASLFSSLLVKASAPSYSPAPPPSSRRSPA
jgi:hypothetical protein